MSAENNTLGMQLTEVLKRFGIDAPVIGMDATAEELTVHVAVRDSAGKYLLDRDNPSGLASISWTANLQDGASKPEPEQ